MRAKPNSESGFTLIEVLVAMLVFAIAIVGLSRAGTESVSNTARLEAKTYAGIVADNVLVETRLTAPEIGTESGKMNLAGREFNWQITTARTDMDGFIEMQVAVFSPDGDDQLIRRTAYRLEQP